MIDIVQKKSCTGCNACASSCPKSCIEMKEDDEGFWYPSINQSECISCNLCEKVCPIIQRWNNNERETKAFAAINLDQVVRLESSSGGIFSLMAEEIINQGGVVFGASFSDDYKRVNHICVDSLDDLYKLRGSKYIQSYIGNEYKIVKKYLELGRMVLFTGTPCQIAGLYNYLQKSYQNLYTQDIICHGVPSPMVWENYVENRENLAGSNTKNVFLRNKENGWKSFSVLFEFSNATKYLKDKQQDSFMGAFLSDLCLRPSCYNCSFKTSEREADITLADFWGIQVVFPEMDDDKGTSLVLVRSSKGNELINKISDKMKYQEVNFDEACRFNPAFFSSSKINKKREDFLKDINSHSFDKIVKKYTKIPIRKKLFRIIKKICRRIIKH